MATEQLEKIPSISGFTKIKKVSKLFFYFIFVLWLDCIALITLTVGPFIVLSTLSHTRSGNGRAGAGIMVFVFIVLFPFTAYHFTKQFIIQCKSFSDSNVGKIYEEKFKTFEGTLLESTMNFFVKLLGWFRR